MNATKNLPKQNQIEEFLGREFFPKYQKPVSLAEMVDLIQLEFQVTDADRAIRMPNGHGCITNGGTILECLVHFAIVRLQEKHCVTHLGANTFVWSKTRYVGKCNRRDVGEAQVSLKILKSSGLDKETAMIKLAGRWHDDVIETAAEKVYETSTCKSN